MGMNIQGWAIFSAHQIIYFLAFLKGGQKRLPTLPLPQYDNTGNV